MACGCQNKNKAVTARREAAAPVMAQQADKKAGKQIVRRQRRADERVTVPAAAAKTA